MNTNLKQPLFVSLTFKDVLSEVKHALLDSVSLLCNLHVFINLMRDKWIRTLWIPSVTLYVISLNIL